MAASVLAIAEAIQDFAAVQRQKPFHMSELTDFVLETVTVAPDSPGRVLRSLRTKGDIDYKLLSRSSSLYQFA